MLTGLLGMLLANTAVLLASRAVVRRAGSGEPWEDAVLFFVVRIGLISGIVLLGGVTRTLTPLGLGAAGAAGIAILGALGDLRPAPLRLDRSHIATGIALGLFAARLLAQVWFFAPYCGDAVTYHLPKVAEWVRAGGFTGELGAHTHVTFPAGFELVEVWWVIFLHHDVLIEMAGVEFLALLFAAAGALAKRLGAGDRGALMAAASAVLTPGLYLQATACLNDLPVAALIVALASQVLSRAPTSLLLLTVGLGLGIKPTFAYALPGIGLLMLRLRGREPQREGGDRRLQLAGAMLGTILGCFWYLRNAISYGNPIYPVAFAGLIDSDGARWIQFGPRADSLAGNVSALLEDRILDRSAPHGATLSRIAGWGPAAFAIGLPSLLILCRKDSAFRTLSLCFVVSLGCVFLLVLQDSWSMRFTLFFPVLLGVAAARIAEERGVVRTLLVLALLIQFGMTFLPAELPVGRATFLAKQSWRDRTTADLIGARAEGSVVGFFGGNRGPAYLLYGPDFSRRVVYLHGAVPEELISAMDREGVKQVFVSADTALLQGILADCVRDGRLRPLRDGFWSRP